MAQYDQDPIHVPLGIALIAVSQLSSEFQSLVHLTGSSDHRLPYASRWIVLLVPSFRCPGSGHASGSVLPLSFGPLLRTLLPSGKGTWPEAITFGVSLLS